MGTVNRKRPGKRDSCGGSTWNFQTLGIQNNAAAKQGNRLTEMQHWIIEYLDAVGQRDHKADRGDQPSADPIASGPRLIHQLFSKTGAPQRSSIVLYSTAPVLCHPGIWMWRSIVLFYRSNVPVDNVRSERQEVVFGCHFQDGISYAKDVTW